MAYEYWTGPLRRGSPGLGLDLVGPDQMWTKETAGKPITEAHTKCPAGSTKIQASAAATEGPRRPDFDCFDTGVILEATKPGLPRRRIWCCTRKKTGVRGWR